MKPHLWLSVLRQKRGQWACCTARRTSPSIVGGMVIFPVGKSEIFYGATPDAAYNKWKEHHVGSA